MFVQLKEMKVIVNTDTISRLYQSRDMERFTVCFTDGEEMDIGKEDYAILTQKFTQENRRFS